MINFDENYTLWVKSYFDSLDSASGTTTGPSFLTQSAYDPL